MRTTNTTELRSRIMRAVKGKDTGPEMLVRRVAYRMGYRYRLHRADLPGKPDLVFSSRRKVIFVHGCFWHGHDCPRGNRVPKANSDYWRTKIKRNRERDTKNTKKLEAEGWDFLIVWECQLRSDAEIASRLRHFLE